MSSHAFIHSRNDFYSSFIQGYYPGERGFLFFPFISSTKTKTNHWIKEWVNNKYDNFTHRQGYLQHSRISYSIEKVKYVV